MDHAEFVERFDSGSFILYLLCDLAAVRSSRAKIITDTLAPSTLDVRPVDINAQGSFPLDLNFKERCFA